ncbi:hypothetical protein [Asaia spathodeae]|uniref:Uncharacterized protein n=1 Tax=Asaia spathodeae TaxID=657016 RepID=A0ABX2P8Z7_9PROT|nr:hypothetical protein [Asaia spathodeae]GBR21083.1 hypothetical protein AA105894_2712 [Asaia spathodeae NBRC 105894]
MAKTDTISVRVLPGRVLTHDGERLEDGEVFDLTKAQATGLLAAGHVERVGIEADDSETEEGDGGTDAEGEEPKKDPAK